MPKSNSIIAAPLREALFECFRATTRLGRPSLLHRLVLVGGAASIAHSSVLVTEDVDVAGPSCVLIDIQERASAGAPKFSFESDGKIAFDAPKSSIRVRVNLIEIGSGCIETDSRNGVLLRRLCCVRVGFVEIEGRDGGRSWERW